jgi:hypothetical protein
MTEPDHLASVREAVHQGAWQAADGLSAYPAAVRPKPSNCAQWPTARATSRTASPWEELRASTGPATVAAARRARATCSCSSTPLMARCAAGRHRRAYRRRTHPCPRPVHLVRTYERFICGDTDAARQEAARHRAGHPLRRGAGGHDRADGDGQDHDPRRMVAEASPNPTAGHHADVRRVDALTTGS